MHLSTTNSKLGFMIPSINLPAGVTCAKDAPCAKGCYAKHGHWLYKNVQKSLRENLEQYKADPESYFAEIIEKTRLYRYVRWHSSGDIVDDAYLLGMIKVAKANPKVEYLCFTKKYKIVNDYMDGGNEIPENLNIMFSGWGAEWEVINPYHFPTSWVIFKDKAENVNIPETAIPCAGHCENCLACWQLVKGQAVAFKKH